MTVYVGNLSYEVTQDDIRAVFEEYGKVGRVSLPMDRDSDRPRPRGFAFVEMGSPEEEESAIEALDGADWMGREMRVNKAKPRESRPKNYTQSSL